MNRITEAEYISALKVIDDYRHQIVKETQDIVGGVNPLPRKNDIIRIIRARGNGNHHAGDEFVVEKATDYVDRIAITSIKGHIIKSTNYDWIICGYRPKTPSPIDHVNKEIDFPDVDLNDLELSVRAYNCLCSLGLRSLYKIIEAGKKGISSHRNMGTVTIEEVISLVFDEYNYLIK